MHNCQGHTQRIAAKDVQALMQTLCANQSSTRADMPCIRPHTDRDTCTCSRLTSAAMQLCPVFCASPEATFVAWYSMSRSDQLPGTMMKGVMLPSSAVTGLDSTGDAPGCSHTHGTARHGTRGHGMG